jgi:hypothetical protein
LSPRLLSMSPHCSMVSLLKMCNLVFFCNCCLLDSYLFYTWLMGGLLLCVHLCFLQLRPCPTPVHVMTLVAATVEVTVQTLDKS